VTALKWNKLLAEAALYLSPGSMWVVCLVTSLRVNAVKMMCECVQHSL